jgi:hypothetical protein
MLALEVPSEPPATADTEPRWYEHLEPDEQPVDAVTSACAFLIIYGVN